MGNQLWFAKTFEALQKSCWTLSDVNAIKPRKLKYVLSFISIFQTCSMHSVSISHLKLPFRTRELFTVVLKCEQLSVRSPARGDRIRLTALQLVEIEYDWQLCTTYLAELFRYHSLTKISGTDFDTPQSTNRKNCSYWHNYDEGKPKWNIENSMQVDYDKGLTLETVKDSSQWPIGIINSVDKTRLSCYALTVLAQSLSHGWQNSKSFLCNAVPKIRDSMAATVASGWGCAHTDCVAL